jgi:phosphatidate cytidylyltransferase
MEQQSAASGGGNLQTRILSGVILGVLVLGAVYLGGLAFAFLVIATAMASVREWVRLVSDNHPLALELSFGFLLAVLIVGIVLGPVAGLAVLAVLAVVLYGVMRAVRAPHRLLIASGIPYVGLASAAFLWLRGLPDAGLELTIWLFFAVWATDVGAYVSGRSIGGPRLAPRISPKKTWAGLIGAVVAAALVGGIAALAFGAAKPAVAAGLAGALALVAQAGDLFESSIKRHFGVKDSGQLIPGHGGILDRIDGLMAAAPALALFHLIAGGALAWW